MALHFALSKISLVMISLTYLGNKPETNTKLFKMSYIEYPKDPFCLCFEIEIENETDQQSTVDEGKES